MKYTRYNSSRRKKTLFNLSPATKTLSILGIMAVVLAVPVTLLLTQNKTETRSNATASTTLSFSQPNPQVNTNDTLSMDVMVDPGQNAVSFVKLVISYDNSQVQPTLTGIVPNSTAFTQVLDGPTYNTCNGTSCTMSVQLSIGSNPTNAITTPTKAATVNFSVIGNNSQTQIGFDSLTQVLSIAPSDSPNENVLSTSNPSTVTIGDISNFTPSPSPAESFTPTPICDPTIDPTCGNASPTSFNPSPTSSSPSPTMEISQVPTLPVSLTPPPGQLTVTPTPLVCSPDEVQKLQQQIADLQQQLSQAQNSNCIHIGWFSICFTNFNINKNGKVNNGKHIGQENNQNNSSSSGVTKNSGDDDNNTNSKGNKLTGTSVTQAIISHTPHGGCVGTFNPNSNTTSPCDNTNSGTPTVLR